MMKALEDNKKIPICYGKGHNLMYIDSLEEVPKITILSKTGMGLSCMESRLVDRIKNITNDEKVKRC